MFESLKQPEYTGENRCPPCTVVNVAIAVAISAVPVLIVGATAVGGAPDGPAVLAASGAILAASLATIYLRGYLVPGTPTLTKRYFPESVLRLFDKAPEDAASTGAVQGADDEETDVSPEAFLLEVGAVEPCEGSEDLCLTDGFREALEAEIEAAREAGVTAGTITRRLGAPEDEYEIVEHYDSWVLRNGARNVGQWPSRAALIADSAGAATLSAWTDRWDGLGLLDRSEVVAGLRIFLVDCPTGEGGVAFEEETVDSCCRQRTVLTLSCEETGERLLEVPAPEAA
jgi:hypothetical protein